MLKNQETENNLANFLPTRWIQPFLLGLVLLIAVLVMLAPPMSFAAPPDPGFALQFDGEDDFVRLDETGLMMSTGWTSTKSVEVWVKPMGTASCSADIPAQCTPANVDAIFGDRARWWGISRGTVGGQDKIWVWNWGTDGERSIGIDYTVGEWVHIALVHSGGVLRAYKNGVEVGSGPSGPTVIPTGPGGLPNHPVLYIGGISNNITRTWVFSGEIDEVRIWNTARTTTELVENMNIPLTGSEPGLAAYYQMSNGSGITVTDNSGHGWTGTLADIVGGVSLPQWVSSGAFNAPMPNLPPTADSQSVSTPEDTAVNITLTGTDPNTDTITFTLTSQPSHGLLGGTPPNLVYTPTTNYNGSDAFTYVADDGLATSSPATATITITPVNDPPVAVDDIAGAVVNLSVVIPVLDNDIDVDGDTLYVTGVSNAQNGLVTSDGTTVIYTPTTAFIGTDYFTYTMNDGSSGSMLLVDTATVTVTVTDVNVPPIAVDDTAQTAENSAVLIDVLANDSDPDNSGTLTISKFGIAAHGVVTNNISSLSYQPDTAFVGTDVFTYEIFDSVNGYDTAAVTVTVATPNNPPTAVDDFAYTALNAEINIDALANDSDAEGDPFSIVAVGNATNGIAVNNGTDITYTPTLNFSGIDVFSYTIADDHAGTDTASITVSVGAGYALQFDGEDDYVQLAESYNVMTPSWTTTKTVEVWIKPTGGSSCSVAANLCDANSVDNIFGDKPRSWGISRGTIGGQDKIWVWNNDNPGGSTIDKIGIDYTLGEWVHIGLVHGGGMLRAYKNGIEVGSIVNTDTVDYGGNILYIGGILSGDRHWVFDGVIDEVRVWNIARNATEIAANINRSLAGNEPGLVAYYKMSDGAGTGLTDDSGNGWTGTLADNGGGTQVLPQWVTSGAFTAPMPSLPPTADSQSVSTPEDTPLSITLTGSDPNGDSITFTLTSQPSHGLLGGTPPNLVYTPTTNYNGSDAFTYVADDGLATSSPATATITVTPVNDPPTAVDDSTSALVNIPLTISVLTNDDDIDGDSLQISAVGHLQNGNIGSDGNTIIFTATAIGTEYFTYTISDGFLNDTAQVTVTVISVNTPPIAVDDTVNTNINVPVTIHARDNDSDPDGGTFSITSLGTVHNGTASTNGNTIAYTPTNNYTGDDSFFYTITDNLGGVDSATITVHINAITIFLPLIIGN